MKKSFQFIFLFSLFIILMGCQQIEQTSVSISVPTPAESKAIIHGNILTEDKSPLSNVVVRLAKVFKTEHDDENGTFILDEANSPSTISEEDGRYYFINIEPGEYVIFIGQLHNDYMVVSDSDQNPNVYEVDEDETLRIEPIIVNFN